MFRVLFFLIAGAYCLAIGGWPVAITIVGLLLPLSYTQWWAREREVWALAGLRLLIGPPDGPDQNDRLSTPAVKRRLSLLMMAVSMLFFVSATLEAHAHDSIANELNPYQDRLCWWIIGLDTLAGVAVFAIGLATTILWQRPKIRVWCSRATIILCMVALFSELFERETIHQVLTKVDSLTYREGIAAVLLETAGTLLFMLGGWAYAERGIH